MQSLFGPCSEPVNGDIIDKTREVTAASLEDLTHWRHSQYDVKIVSTFLYEI